MPTIDRRRSKRSDVDPDSKSRNGWRIVVGGSTIRRQRGDLVDARRVGGRRLRGSSRELPRARPCRRPEPHDLRRRDRSRTGSAHRDRTVPDRGPRAESGLRADRIPEPEPRIQREVRVKEGSTTVDRFTLAADERVRTAFPAGIYKVIVTSSNPAGSSVNGNSRGSRGFDRVSITSC